MLLTHGELRSYKTCLYLPYAQLENITRRTSYENSNLDVILCCPCSKENKNTEQQVSNGADKSRLFLHHNDDGVAGGWGSAREERLSLIHI